MRELFGWVILGVDWGVVAIELRKLLRGDVRGSGRVKRVRELRGGDVLGVDWGVAVVELRKLLVG